MTLPSIPDNLYKFLVFAALICIGYYFYILDVAHTRYQSKSDVRLAAYDSIELKVRSVNKESERLNKEANQITDEQNRARKYIDTSTLKKRLAYYESELDFNTRLHSIHLKILAKNEELEPLFAIYDLRKRDFEAVEKDFEDTRVQAFYLGLLFFILLGTGLFGLFRHQTVQDELIQRQLGQMEKSYKSCQSCGKSFNSLREFGKRADGTLNKGFCKDCYDFGQFTEPNLTIDDILERTKKEFNTLMKRQVPFKIINRLKNLDRWKKINTRNTNNRCYII